MPALEDLDAYLLSEKGEKATLVRALLGQRSSTAAAAPFYRMLESIGERVPDDALCALRIALAGSYADDSRVLTIRALVNEARAVRDDPQALAEVRARYEAALKPS
jgi:hypothetical protein